MHVMTTKISGRSRIFLRGAPTPKVGIFFQLFAKNCMKMKEFGWGARLLGSANEDGSSFLSNGVTHMT